MPVTLEQFAKSITDSGIISADDLRAFHQRLDPKPTDAQGLAKELVRKKKLTKFQANQAYQGKGKALVFGEYVVLDKIGEGGMGQVYKAQHRRMKRVVAIKVLPPGAVDSDDAVRRFEREVEAAAKLIHPNVVAAFDAGEAHGNYFLVMEYVEGKDLSVLLKDNGPLPVEKAVHYTIQAARGLEFAHGEGVVHRDVKPNNLLLDTRDTVKILDMGLARFAESADGNDDTADRGLTQSGQIMGTVDYMAPEQAQDTKDADERSDIYSLGCTLYRLLTNKPVYTGTTLINTLVAHREADIPSLCEEREDVSSELNTIYQRMLAKKPEDRYQTMSEVVAGLEALGTAPGSSPGVVGGASSDSALTDFLQGTADGASTAQGKTTQRKATRTRQVSSNANQAALGKQKKWLAIGGGVLGAVVLLGLVFAFLRGDGDQETSETLGMDAARKNATTDRAAAEWVLGIGGAIKTDAGRVFKEAGQLPKQPFRIVSVILKSKRQVTDNDLARLEGLTTLGTLWLSFTHVSDTGLEHLKGLTNLTDLQLTRTQVSDTGLEHLRGLTNLTSLTLGNTKVTPQGVADLQKALPDCDIQWDGSTAPDRAAAQWVLNSGGIIVTDAGRFSDAGLLPDKMFRITEIRLNGSKGKGDVKELSNLKGLRNLSKLSLSTLPIGDAELQHLSSLSSLTSLVLTHTRIGDEGVEHLSGLTSLMNLALGGTQVSDKGLKHLKGLSKLKTLDLQVTQVTTQGIADLQRSLLNCNITWDGNSASDRAAAQWVLGIGGSVETDKGTFTEMGQLPQQPFQIISVNLYGKREVTGDKLKYLKGLTKLTNLGLASTSVRGNGFNHLTGLSNLTTIALAHSPVEDVAMLQLKKLKKLTNLNLSHTRITDTGIEHLKVLRDLTQLIIDHTKVSDTGLEHLEGHTTLRELNIQFTQVSDAGMKHLAGLTNLTKLVLANTQVSDRGLTHLEGLTNLELLAIGNTQVTDGGLVPLKGLTKLANLTVQGTQVSDAGLEHLKAMTKLRFLDLRGTQVTAQGVADLEKALPNCSITWDSNSDPDRAVAEWVLGIGGKVNIYGEGFIEGGELPEKPFHILEVVLLNNRQVTDDSLKHLRGLTKPWKLYIPGTQVSELEHLTGLTHLTYLNLNHSQVSDTGLDHLKGLRNLKDLDLVGTQITAQGINDLKKALPNCGIKWDDPSNPDPNRTAAQWVLGIGGWVETEKGKITEVGQLPQQPFRIISVLLHGNRQVTDDNLEHLKGLTKLTQLGLGATSIRGMGLIHLKGATNLTTIHLAHSEVGDTALLHLKALANLTHLNLFGSKISDAGIEYLKEVRQLKNLNVANTQISDTGLEHLKGLVNLTTLRLQKTQVTAGGIADLQKALPGCEITWDGNTDPDREAAQWVLGMGGVIETDVEKFTEIEKLPATPFRIVKINLHFTPQVKDVTDGDLERLVGLTKLKTLVIAGSQIGDASLVYLKRLTNLTYLGLQNTQVSDTGLDHLKGLTKLSNLHLNGTKVTAGGIANLKKSLPGCEITGP